MTSLKCSESILKVFISRDEKITFSKAKNIMMKSRRMIQQNEASSALIEFENTPIINKSALEFFYRVLCNNSDFPVAIIGG